MGFSCGPDNSTSNFTPNFQMSFSILESAQIVAQQRVKPKSKKTMTIFITDNDRIWDHDNSVSTYNLCGLQSSFFGVTILFLIFLRSPPIIN